MKKKYIIGLDFGKEKTRAWAVPFDNKNNENYGESLLLRRSNDIANRFYYSVIYKLSDNKYTLDDLTDNLITGFKEKI